MFKNINYFFRKISFLIYVACKIFQNDRTFRNFKQLLNTDNDGISSAVIIDDYTKNLAYISDKFENYFYREDFESKLSLLTKNLDKKDKNYLKFLYERILNVSSLNKNRLFTNEELCETNKLKRYYINNVKKVNDVYIVDKYKFSNRHFEINNLFYRVGIPLIKNTEYFRNKDLIDAGACGGDTSLIMAEYTDKNVYAFEPFEDGFNSLVKTIELNKYKNIIPVNYALDKENSEKLIMGSFDGMGSTRIDEDKAFNEIAYTNKHKIKTVTIDKFVQDNNLEIGLIKIDVEGYEQNVLLGAMETIQKFKPAMLISIYHNPNDFFEIKPMIENLNLGYSIKVVKTLPDCFIEGATLICEIE